MAVTYTDLQQFVIKNKRKNVFKEIIDDKHLLHVIYRAVSQGTMSYTVDKDNNIVGLALGMLFPDEKVFYVTQILTTKPKVLAILLNKFRSMYPGYSLRAKRHDKERGYDTDKFIERVNRFTEKGII